MARSEDSLVAYTWMHYLNDTSKPEYICFLPMVKSGVKALDTVEAFIKAGIDDY
jgi:PhoPQ-activated pathogenicity-related protein